MTKNNRLLYQKQAPNEWLGPMEWVDKFKQEFEDKPEILLIKSRIEDERNNIENKTKEIASLKQINANERKSEREAAAKSEQEAAQVATEGIKARALMHGQAVNHDIASMKLQERLLDTKGKAITSMQSMPLTLTNRVKRSLGKPISLLRRRITRKKNKNKKNPKEGGAKRKEKNPQKREEKLKEKKTRKKSKKYNKQKGGLPPISKAAAAVLGLTASQVGPRKYYHPQGREVAPIYNTNATHTNIDGYDYALNYNQLNDASRFTNDYRRQQNDENAATSAALLAALFEIPMMLQIL